jgi:hypothetical protein
MQRQILFLSTLVWALGAFAPNTYAQIVDRISSINGEDFQGNDQKRIFNRSDCGLDPEGGTGGTGGSALDGGVGGAGGTGGTGGAAAATAPKGSPEETFFDIRLGDSGGAISSVYLWVGTGGAKCESLEERNGTQGNCAEMSGNPQQVGTNFLVSGLTLQNLIDASSGFSDIVSCASSGLTGTPYKIFAFRNEPPSGDVPATNYGVTEFYVDVVSPAPPLVNTTPQEASTFTISWANPNPPDDIQAWLAYVSDVDDPSTADPVGSPINLASRDVSFRADQLGLSEAGDTAYVFVQAYDQAFVSDSLGGNQSALSEGVEVTFVNTVGFCDSTGDCTGCSASPMNLASTHGPGGIVWMLGLLASIAFVGRRRR